MKNAHRHGLAIVCATALSAMLPASSSADTIYTYTGNGFSFASSPYTSTDSVSGWIDLSAPLGISQFTLTITPVSYSFYDGVQTITNSNAAAGAFFGDIQTNSSGDIILWSISMSSTTTGGTIATDKGQSDVPFDEAFSLLAGVGSAGNTDHPGTWLFVTTTVSTTPIPAALPLFASGLGAMGLLGWRRKRKVAAVAA